jgi:hypothetical protein
MIWTAIVAGALPSLTLVLHGQGTQGTNRFIVPPLSRGGLNPAPHIYSLTTTQNWTLKWTGFLGPYQLQRSTEAGPAGVWENLGVATSGKSATYIPQGPVNFLRVLGPEPYYAGAPTCAICHQDTHATWLATAHAGALETLKNIGQGANADCLKCHTAGYGSPNGYIDEATTPGLAGVQCENCHGPAGQHTLQPSNLSVRPVKSPDAKICGGCHTDVHHPTYDEWSGAGHAHVVPSVASSILSSGESRMLSCGVCHSGGVRVKLLRQLTDPTENLPSREDAAELAVTCSVCHNAHEATANPHQLRNPRYSTNFYSYSTSASTTFAAQYNPNLQVCAQCHNSRGGLPTETSRPPHHSPQYNMLIGQLTPTNYTLWTKQNKAQIRAVHGIQAAQCTACHTHAHEVENPDIENPNYTGHTFQPHLQSCVICHGTEEEAEAGKTETQAEIKLRIQDVKTLLDQWGQTKALEPLRVKYGSLAWEFNNVGQISNPNGGVGPGPTTTEQADVPAAIKDARFYLYMVEHDGSFGVHNSKYARFLLNQAQTNVVQLLNAP